MKYIICLVISLILAFLPSPNFLTFKLNAAQGADAQNEDENEQAEEGQGPDDEELLEETYQKPAEGQATNGKEDAKKEEKGDAPKPENPPTEEPMPKPSDLMPPIEPEINNKPMPPPAPPRGSLKAKKPQKPAKTKGVEKGKKKEKVKPKEKAMSKAKVKDKTKNTKGMKTVNSSCNVRAKADKDAKKLGMLDPGQKIKAEPSGKKWFKITHKGRPAYVSAVCF
ncbi:MAG: hypothetical protein A4S09_11955 [Proteobacteria bacterium SG_bin7]|nr:MAG: hypothetical protein A4S09_11955 [Proteobacteria bacterium SG_bin7]